MTKAQYNLAVAHWQLAEEYRKHKGKGGGRIAAIEKTLNDTAGQCMQLIHREQLRVSCL